MRRLEELIGQLGSRSAEDRLAAVEALGQLGSEARGAVLPLLWLYGEVWDSQEGWAIGRALRRMDASTFAMNSTTRSDVQDQASAREWARALGEVQAREVLRHLLRASEDPGPDLELLQLIREALTLVL